MVARFSDSQGSRVCLRRCSRLDYRHWFWLVGRAVDKNGAVAADADAADGRTHTLLSCGCRSRWKSRLRSRRRCVEGFAGIVGPVVHR